MSLMLVLNFFGIQFVYRYDMHCKALLVLWLVIIVNQRIFPTYNSVETLYCALVRLVLKYDSLIFDPRIAQMWFYSTQKSPKRILEVCQFYFRHVPIEITVQP